MNDDELVFRDRLNDLPFDDSCRLEHHEQLRERVLAAFDEAQTKPSAHPVPGTYSRWRTFMNRPVSRFAAAALIAASLCAVYLSFFSTHSATAFAQMADPIIKAKTARFTVVVEGKDLPKQTFRTLVLEPNRLRQELPTGQVQIVDGNAGRMMLLTPARKTALLTNLTEMPQQKQPANFFDQLRTSLQAAEGEASLKREPLGQKQIDGRKTIGFRLKTPDREMTIWGDPKTNLPIQVEMTLALLPDTKVTMTHFEFDVELDETLFAVKPPDGYNVQQIEVSAAAATEPDLIATLKLLSDHNKGRFPDAFDNGAVASVVTDWAIRNNPVQPGSAQMAKLTELSLALNRGMAFAVALPVESKARYAGKGIKRDDKTAPVFWYQPAGASDYRVIYADLSVKAQKVAPESPNSVTVNVGASVTDRLRKILKEQLRPVEVAPPIEAAPPVEVAPPAIRDQPKKAPPQVQPDNLAVGLVRRADPPEVKGKLRHLTSKDLIGTWRGEKDGMKIKIVFAGAEDATWMIDTGKGGLTADLKRVDKERGSVHLRFDSVAKPAGTVLGHLERGEAGTLKLTILPIATKVVSQYKPVEGFPLNEVKIDKK